MNRSNLSRLGLIAIIATLVYGLSFLPLGQWGSELAAWGRQHTVAAALVYIAFVAIATALFLPGWVAMMTGGFLFGFGPGLLFAAVAIPLGSQCAFEVARWVARAWVQKKIVQSSRLLAIEAALQEQAFLIVVLTRLSLIIPFNLLNYAYGATAVRAGTHFFATAVGMLPAIGLYVYIGSVAQDLGQILSGDAAPSELGCWVVGAGVVVIAMAAWVIHRTATRALEKHIVKQQKVESNG